LKSKSPDRYSIRQADSLPSVVKAQTTDSIRGLHKYLVVSLEKPRLAAIIIESGRVDTTQASKATSSVKSPWTTYN